VGGGRYNKLATEIGGKTDIPSIGAAIGIERLLLLVEETFPLPPDPALYLIVPLSFEQQSLGMHLFDFLYTRGYATDILLQGDSLKRMLRIADKRGAHACIIIGSDEQAAGTVTIKHMTTRTMITVPQSELLQNL